MFKTGDSYVIYSGFATHRQYKFHLNYRGSATLESAVPGGDKRRDVIASGQLPPVAGDPVVSIRDFDATGLEVGEAAVTIPDHSPNPQPVGTITTSGIHVDFEPGVDLPSWFITDQWYRLVLVSYAAGFSPGSALQACTPGAPGGAACLMLNGANPGNNIQALAIAAGEPLPSIGQNRSSGLLTDYFEGENAISGDNTFVTAPTSSSFNDKVRIVAPSPFP